AILDYFDHPPLIVIVNSAETAVVAQAKIEETQRLAAAQERFPVIKASELFFGLNDIVADNRDRGGQTLELAGALEDGGKAPSLGLAGAPSFAGELGDFASEVRRLRKKNVKTVVVCERPGQIDDFRNIMEAKFPGFDVQYSVGWLRRGFVGRDIGFAFFPAQAIMSRRRVRLPHKRGARFPSSEDTIKVGSIFDLKPSELVVHIEHGIGRFVGLSEQPVNGADEEFMEIEYADENKLFLPVYNLRMVQKYVGGTEKARLDKLGGLTWRKARKKANEAAEELAKRLLKVYAERRAHPGYAFGGIPDWEDELVAGFPFVETDDQLTAIGEVNRDMSSERPMDRLICGDVGFGKTEVAVRAALRAVAAGKQTAVLVPTTILAQQHYATFTERLKDFPVVVEVVSRFKSPSKQKDIVERLKKGTIDVVIGTHRLLSKDVEFSDLGLLVIDEEQRFGVKHKERIKELRRSIEVLTLTATPIPRTLYMALSGIRDISTITTPPIDRLPITTYIAPFDENLITEAVNRELERAGQVFFVHNRVRSISAMCEYLREILPGVRFGVAHGQMDERELERVMVTFQNRDIDVLVSSSIIESGLDIPNVNTIIVNRADTFGLSQLHQLRGRVGRSHEQAYAFLLTPATTALTDKASRRLRAIKEATELGSGYRLAMRDLEIRGAGNLLGAEQSGHVSAVGLEMYMKLLNAAVSRLKGKQPPPDEGKLALTVSFEAGLPRGYIRDERQRLNLYRRISEIGNEAGIADIEGELRDRFGRLPWATTNLLELQRIRLHAAAVPLRSITIKRNAVHLEFEKNAEINPASFPALDFIEDVKRNATSGGGGLRVRLTIDEKKDILKVTQEIINRLKNR
ncbi:MAG: transcription-repair coupling factor, partial [bacterium]|nr:transcription-repair coupling factor [bacterium]